jgi:hypothetical protein
MNSGCPPLTAGPLVIGLRRRQLHRMRRIENHRRKLAHDRQRTHIDDEIVVAETRSALREKNLRVARIAAFLDRVPHIPRRDKLAFLNVDRAPAQRGSDNKSVCRQRNAGICNTSATSATLAHVGRFVHVGQNRNLQFVFDLLQNPQTFL